MLNVLSIIINIDEKADYYSFINTLKLSDSLTVKEKVTAKSIKDHFPSGN